MAHAQYGASPLAPHIANAEHSGTVEDVYRGIHNDADARRHHMQVHAAERMNNVWNILGGHGLAEGCAAGLK